MRHGGDKRGSTTDRRVRKLWLLHTYGNGRTVSCVHCERELTYATLEADRIIPGASYRRDNIQPSCRSCNVARGNDETWVYVGA